MLSPLLTLEPLGEVDDIRAEPLGSKREGKAGAGGILKEEIGDDAAAESGDFLDGAIRDIREGTGGAEEGANLVGGEILEAEEAAAVPDRSRIARICR